MKIYYRFDPKYKIFTQVVFVYAWLTVLAPLSTTDTYYSIYLICGILGLFCMFDNYQHPTELAAKQRTGLLVCSSIFAVAVALANYSLFEPLKVLQNLFDAACVLTGGCVIGYNVLYCCLRRLPIMTAPGIRSHGILVFFLVFSSIALIDVFYLFFVLYPGVLTTDAFSTIAQILGQQDYNNTMPFWHTVIVGQFIKLGIAAFGDINAAVALFHTAQILFMSACMAYAVVTLYQIGVPKIILICIYALYAFMPYNIVYSVTLWKDVPFSGAALLLVTAFYRLLKGIGKWNWLNYGCFLLGALGFSLLRTNGWYAFLAMVLVMLFLLRKSHRKLLVMMIVVLLACWILINPLLDLLGVSGTNFVEAFAVPMQQVARVVSMGRELTAEEQRLLSEIFLLDKLGAVYDPLTVDPVKFETFRYDRVNYILDNIGSYLKLYLGLLTRYPGDFIKAWVDETKGYWNGGYFFWTYTLKMGNNTFGIVQIPGENILARLYSAWFRYVEKPAILQFTTSIGLYVWGLITCFFVNIWKKREEFLLVIPILVLIVGLWLGTPVYAEFRYAYPMILSLPFILGVTVFQEPKIKTE